MEKIIAHPTSGILSPECGTYIRNVSRQPSRPVVELVVTPSLAKILLENSHPSQRHKKCIVKKYAVAIKTHQWPPDWGVPFAFDKQGRMINGKQRCEAVIESGETIIVLATLDHDEKDILLFDPLAASRQVGDILAMHGVKNAVRTGSAIRWIWRYITGQMHSATTVPNALALKFEETNPDIAESVTFGGRLSRYVDGGPMGGFHWMFSMVNRDAANRFCETLEAGIDLTADSPIWVLRRKLEQANASVRRIEKRLPLLNRLALLTMTWNRYFDEQPAAKLSWLGGPFPKIRGLEEMKPEDLGF